MGPEGRECTKRRQARTRPPRYAPAVRLGLFAVNFNTCADPEACIRVVQAAEQAGFDSVWTGEHVVLPSPATDRSPLPPTTPMLDTGVAAAYIAAHTSTIRIGTGIIILPLRHPVLLAKELASLDVVSGGRLIAGFGAGYLPEEFDAMGVPLSERGARMDEYLAALRALWTMDQPEFEGRFVSFTGVDAHPRPVQPGGPPLVLGGGSEAAVRRAIRLADGFYAFGVDLAWMRELNEFVDRVLRHEGRPDELGDLEIIVTPIDGQTPDQVRRYEELGVDCLVALPGDVTDRSQRHRPVPIDEILRTIETLSALIDK